MNLFKDITCKNEIYINNNLIINYHEMVVSMKTILH